MMKMLVIIPARGGSKGLPGKNMRLLNGKPLIYYSIDIARSVANDEDICVSTDDWNIVNLVEQYGLRVPFIRPAELATDTATSNDVLLHAVSYYQMLGKKYDVILLLQPTSPLRTKEQLVQAIELYSSDIDMVVSVKKSHTVAVLCKDNSEGFLEPVLTNVQCRQDAPDYFEYNGAIYIINIRSLCTKGMANFNREKKFVMPDENSIDIDTILDFNLAEVILRNEVVTLE